MSNLGNKNVSSSSSNGEELTLQAIKKGLQDMGLSTATDGLVGDDRFDELKHRLLKAKGMVSERLSSSSLTSSSHNRATSPLSKLSIGEIRSRLSDLGESTSTPGLVGEERRVELMRRLTMAICGSNNDESNAILDEMVDRKIKDNDEKMDFITNIISKGPDPPAPTKTNTNIIIEQINDKDDKNKLDITITNGDISEIKKTLKRILNKRAIAVAGKLSGTNQDPELKENEKNSTKAEAELARLRVQKQQSNSTTISSSSILIDGGSKMPIDKLIQKLDNLKAESKEQIRIVRLRIREEVDQHPEYGTAAEEELQAALRNANYTKGRTRRKIDEIKAMNTDKSSKGSNDINDRSDEKQKPAQMKESIPVKSKSSKSMENGLDSRWDNLEALGDRQKREFEELMADLGHEDDLFDLKGLSDEMLKPKDLHPDAAKQVDRSAIVKSGAVVLVPRNAPTIINTESAKDHKTTTPVISTKIINYNEDDDDDVDNDDDENEDTNNSEEEDEEEDEVVTRYSPPPTSEPMIREKPSYIKRLLEEQEKERQAMIQKRNDAASDDKDDNDDKNKYDPDMKYISNIYENLQPVAYTASTPKSSANTNPNTSRTEVISPRRAEEKPSSPVATLSSKIISPIDTSTSSIIEKRKPPPPNQPPSNRPPISPTAKFFKRPDLIVDTSFGSRPITANENVSRPQTAPATPKTPISAGVFAKSKEEADSKAQSPKISIKAAVIDSEDEDEDDDEEAEGDNRKQVKTLLKHAKVLEGLGDLVSAESMFARALELNPLDISSLNSYAVFLHNKRGELTRAESFFGRAIHTLLPDLYEAVCIPNPSKVPRAPPVFDINDTKPHNDMQDKPTVPKTKYKVVVNCLLNYAGFLSRAKGDIESAQIVYAKAMHINPNDAKVLGIVAHFLAEEGGNSKKAADIFARAMKLDPNNAKHAMWYAKVLKKQSKHGQAELMYMVALQKSQDDKKIEPTAICNYATYIFKHKKDKVKAQQMFIEGLEKYPGHKGLVKNYSTLLKANPNMGSSESLRQPTPMSAKNRLRVDSAIKAAALERINSPIPTSNLSRVNSSSAFTLLASSGFDASRGTTPDLAELKRVINRKLTPYTSTRKTTAISVTQDEYEGEGSFNVVESGLDTVTKDSWMMNENSGFFSNSPGNEDSDSDGSDDLYDVPISPTKR